jgi:hypothetical protein
MEDDREKNLPKWAQEIINRLRRDLEQRGEILAREVAKLRPLVDLYKARNDALTELLECAARGQHKPSQEIIEILQTYDLTLTRHQ